MNRVARVFLLLGFCLICVGGVFWQARRERIRRATPNRICAVVWKQIVAMREDDYAGAYRQVSSGFQEKFSREAFSDFARAEYPSVRRAQRVEFGLVRTNGREATVPVYLFLEDGEVVPCWYRLINEGEGWKIDSARFPGSWSSGRRLGGLRV